MKERLRYNEAIYSDAEKQAVMQVLDSEYLSGGEQTARFENELAEWWGTKHGLSTNSGSSANFIAVQALELPKGSEVITPAGGAFPTTVSPLVYHGLKPVFVDIDLDTLCINLDDVSAILSRPNNARAIVFAHTLGNMPDMGRLMTIAKRHNLKVLEDCCDAVGSEQDGKKAGTFGDVATVSFYPAHHITTGGEGGAILTNDTKLFWDAHSIRDWGRDCKCRWGGKVPACPDRFGNPPFDHRYYYTNMGMNLKLTEMQAAFGREQLKRLDGFIELRRRNYNILANSMGMQEVTGLSPFAFPIICHNKEHAMKHLAEAGIDTRALFSGNILEHPAYKHIEHRTQGTLKNSKRLMKGGFFVGCGPHLTEDNMNYIADKLKEVL